MASTSLPPEAADPTLIPAETYLWYIHLAVKLDSPDAIRGRMQQVFSQPAAGNAEASAVEANGIATRDNHYGVDAAYERVCLAYFRDTLLGHFCQLHPLEEYALRYQHVLQDLPREGRQGFCRTLYLILMGNNILSNWPDSVPLLPSHAIRHLACGHETLNEGQNNMNPSHQNTIASAHNDEAAPPYSIDPPPNHVSEVQGTHDPPADDAASTGRTHSRPGESPPPSAANNPNDEIGTTDEMPSANGYRQRRRAPIRPPPRYDGRMYNSWTYNSAPWDSLRSHDNWVTGLREEYM